MSQPMKTDFISLTLVIGVLLFNFYASTLILGRSSTKKSLYLESESQERKSPSVAAYRKNYRGDVIQVITQVPNSQVTLPSLRFEDHNWEGYTIELECNATYPVAWVYNGVGAPPVHMRTQRNVPDFFDKATYVYQASVIFTHTTETQTGNYTCRSIEFDTFNSTNSPTSFISFLYLFVPGNRIFLADVEETQIAVAVYENPWITLPCAVSDSDARVVLNKKLSNGMEVLKPGRHLTFDPKVGFQIQWEHFLEPWADYVCIGETNKNKEELNVTLAPPQQNQGPDTKPNDFENTLASKIPEVRFTTDEQNNRILCCSSTNQRPSMTSTGCSSVPDCHLRRKYLERKRCLPTCEKHVINVGRTCVSYEMSEMHDESGMLRCVIGDVVKYFLFSKEHDILITNFTVFPRLDQILSIDVENSPKQGKLFINCHTNSFFFSNGLIWAWKRPNGSMEVIKTPRPPAPNYLEVDKKENVGSKIYCFAPLWNSATEWKNQSISIT